MTVTVPAHATSVRLAAPLKATLPDDLALARYRAGLEEIGRRLGWTRDAMAEFVEDVAGCPWAGCGWAECDAIVAAYREVLDRCAALATRRRSGSARDAGGLPLPPRRRRERAPPRWLGCAAPCRPTPCKVVTAGEARCVS